MLNFRNFIQVFCINHKAPPKATEGILRIRQYNKQFTTHVQNMKLQF